MNDRTDCVDDTGGERRANAAGMADGDDERADPGGVRIAEGRDRHPGARSADQREIGVRVTRQQLSRETPAIDELQRHAGPSYDVRVRHDVPRRPEHARPQRLIRLIGHLDGDPAQILGETGEIEHHRASARRGRSPTSTGTSRGSPPRSTDATVRSPTRSGRNAVLRSVGSVMRMPPSETTTSPTSKPAAAAGLPGCTSTTTTAVC